MSKVYNDPHGWISPGGAQKHLLGKVIEQTESDVDILHFAIYVILVNISQWVAPGSPTPNVCILSTALLSYPDNCATW